MRKLILIATSIITLFLLAGTAGAVTLVNPDGTPVGGIWQQWVDKAKVPTISGTLVFTPFQAGAPNPCVGALACSTGDFPGDTQRRKRG